jgi:hypothetical protein
MNENTSLISAGGRIVSRHKRYIFWFWLLNLTLAEFGTSAFRNHAHAILDRSLFSDRLLHGFDLSVLLELMSRPEMGALRASTMPALYSAFLFCFATVLFLPGVLEAYTSEGRLSREEFFRTCGRNLGRFIRLLLFLAVISLPVAGALFSARGALVKAADKSTNEMMPFYVELATLAGIFLVMTAIRIWFDLAQVDIVVRDQRAVRKSVAAAFRYTRRNLLRLLAVYGFVALVGLVLLVAGAWFWHAFVPPTGTVRAFLVGEMLLFLWLGMRFWQRASASAFYLRAMAVPAPVATQPEPIPPPPFAPPVVSPTPEGAPPV